MIAKCIKPPTCYVVSLARCQETGYLADSSQPKAARHREGSVNGHVWQFQLLTESISSVPKTW